MTILVAGMPPFADAGDLEEATGLQNKRDNLFNQGKYAEAAEIGEQLLAAREKALGPEHPSVAKSLNDLATLYYLMGDRPRAVPLMKRSISIYEKVLGPDHPTALMAAKNLADAYTKMGKYSLAEPLYMRALAVREEALGPDHPVTATAVNELAVLYVKMGDYARAESLYIRAGAINEKALGPDHPRIATDLNNLAALYFHMGDYARAEHLYKRALEIYEEAYGPEHPEMATTLNNFAELYSGIGDYSKAEHLHKRALEIREKALGREHPDLAQSFSNMALLYYRKKDYSKALDLARKALDVWEKTLGREHPDTAIATNLMGILNLSIGEYAAAEYYFKRALLIKEETLGTSHPNTATGLHNLALLYNSTGEHAKAESLYRRALEIYENALGPEHPAATKTVFSLAFMQGTQGRSRESLMLFQRGLASQERTIRNVFSITSEKQKLVFVTKLGGGYDGALSLIHQKFSSDQQALRAGLDAVLSRKAIVFDAQARQREAIAKALDPEARRFWQELSSRRATLAKMLQIKPEPMSSEMYRLRIERLKTEIEKLESRLASISGLVAKHVEQGKATAENVAGRLPKGAVLAEFVKIQYYDWDKGKWADTRRYLAFVLHPDARIELIDLGEAQRLETDIKALMAELTELSRNKKDINTQLDAASGLYSILWRKLEKAVGSAVTIIVSPDGALNLVPFGALRGDDGRFLAERSTVTYVTSGRDLMRGGAGVKPEADLFLAADPVFDMVAKTRLANKPTYRDVTRSREFSLKFAPLPGTAQEAKVIPPSLPGKVKQVVTGAGATEQTVLNSRRPRVLHLATHGFFLEDQAEIAPDDRHVGLDMSPKLPKGYENPLVRSGLAFAGANRAAEAETSLDGLLTALEVSGMNLHGTELVTLSACETGVGEVKTGEGVYGLRRAFALAGARNLLMSLWPVTDKITAEQMEKFYRLYGRGKIPAEALQEAQLETIAKLRKEYGAAPPSLWAPFILQGSPGMN